MTRARLVHTDDDVLTALELCIDAGELERAEPLARELQDRQLAHTKRGKQALARLDA